MPDLVFEVERLSKVYRSGAIEVRALDGVDLTMAAGEMIVLLGPSGSGKSTLLNILGGLDRPRRARSASATSDLTASNDRELTTFRRRHVGFIFQFYNLIPSPDRARERGAGHRTRRRADDARGGAAPGRASPIAWTTSPPSCPAASNSASPSRAPSRSGPRCCCATSRPARSTARPASACSRRSPTVNRDARHDHRRHHPQRRDRRHGQSRDPFRRRARRECAQPHDRAKPPSFAGESGCPRSTKAHPRHVAPPWAGAGDRARHGSAVATLVMALGALRSLSEAREAYYDRHAFAHVFVDPEARAGRLAAGSRHPGRRGRRHAHRPLRTARHRGRAGARAGLALSLPDASGSAQRSVCARALARSRSRRRGGRSTRLSRPRTASGPGRRSTPS